MPLHRSSFRKVSSIKKAILRKVNKKLKPKPTKTIKYKYNSTATTKDKDANPIIKKGFRMVKMASTPKYMSFSEAILSRDSYTIGDTLILIASHQIPELGFYAFTADLTPVTVIYGLFKNPSILYTRGDAYLIKEVDYRMRNRFRCTENTRISKAKNIEPNWNSFFETYGETDFETVYTNTEKEKEISVNICISIFQKF